MADRFIPLSELLVQPSKPEVEPESTEALVTQTDETSLHIREVAGEIRRFRAAVRDAVDVAVHAVLCDVAAEVLARELELAPANIREIVGRARVRHCAESVACVRVHPDEAAHLAGAGVDVVADAELRRGDALLQVRAGTIDATLGARLAVVLDGIAP